MLNKFKKGIILGKFILLVFFSLILIIISYYFYFINFNLLKYNFYIFNSRLYLISNVLSNNLVLFGTYYSIINNYSISSFNKFIKVLQIIGVGYSFFYRFPYIYINSGYSHEVKLLVPQLVKICITSIKNGSNIYLVSYDKNILGDFVSLLLSIKPLNPYTLKGIRNLKNSYVKKKFIKK